MHEFLHGFLSFLGDFGAPGDTKNREKSTSKTMFFSDAFLTLMFIDLETIFDDLGRGGPEICFGTIDVANPKSF